MGYWEMAIDTENIDEFRIYLEVCQQHEWVDLRQEVSEGKKSRMTHVIVLRKWLVGKPFYIYMEETGEKNIVPTDYW